MNLLELFSEIDTKNQVWDHTVLGITNDSRKVQKDTVYIAIPGAKVDGHDYAASALEKGAVAVVVERDLGLERQILVEDSRKAYAKLCAAWFGNPSKKLKLIGITGTNGKTSVTTMIKHILEDAGFMTGLIGTIQIEFGSVVRENPNTTPDAYLFQQTLREMADAGCQYVVSEVSSHALAQDRVYGCHFEVCAFTNLTQDHLDYHKDMEDYYQAKKKLFSMGNINIVNVRDPYGKRLAEELGEGTVTFSREDPHADFYANDIVCYPDSVQFCVTHNGIVSRIRFAIPGLYSVENTLTAIAVCSQLGISVDNIVTALGKMSGVTGRGEIIAHNDRFTVIRDYAHTPDGIENVLKSMRDCSKGRLVALFGCGGDRDRTKRPKMAAACCKYADFVIVTSDNPRSEDPDEIIREILPGMKDGIEYVTITNRKDAIHYAMDHAQTGDVILLLGKGHETYQVLKEGTIHFDEKEVVEEYLTQMEL